VVDVPKRGRRGAAVEDLHRVGVDQTWVLHTTGFGHLDQVASKRLDVIRETDRLQLGVEAMGQPSVLGGDPRSDKYRYGIRDGSARFMLGAMPCGRRHAVSSER
jgi:hypothetical protein